MTKRVHHSVQMNLTLSQTCPDFYVSAVQVFQKHFAHIVQVFLFPQYFLPVWRTFCHFHQVQNCPLKTFCLEESKICHLGKLSSLITTAITKCDEYPPQPAS